MWSIIKKSSKSKVLLRSFNSFQICHVCEGSMPKNIVPNTEPPKYNGFYIEAGAGDGEIISNSLYFEINYKVICKNYNLRDALAAVVERS